MRPWFVMLGAAVVTAACSQDMTAPPPAPAPPRIQLDSLRAVNDTSLPCCATVAGALTFYAPAHWDTAYSPGGPVDASCVTLVPNGELVDDFHGVATSADSVTIPLFACGTGSFRLTLQSSGSGSPSLAQAGYFAWSVDSAWHSGTLILVDTIGGVAWSIKVTGTTFTVPSFGFPRRSYDFAVVRGEE